MKLTCTGVSSANWGLDQQGFPQMLTSLHHFVTHPVACLADTPMYVASDTMPKCFSRRPHEPEVCEAAA